MLSSGNNVTNISHSSVELSLILGDIICAVDGSLVCGRFICAAWSASFFISLAFPMPMQHIFDKKLYLPFEEAGSRDQLSLSRIGLLFTISGFVLTF